MSNNTVPEEVLQVADDLPYTPTHFEISASGIDYPDVLIATLKEQPAFADWEDTNGNVQTSVRLDLVNGVYWLSGNGGTQADVDAAVSAYPAKLTEMYPSA